MIKIIFKLKLKDSLELDIKTKIPLNKITIINGESGSGKTTLLNCISGIYKPTYGFLKIKNEILYDSKKNINISINLRNIGYIKQDSKLFSNLSILDNIMYGYNRTPENYIDIKKTEIIDYFKINDLINKNINKLSGGEKQRISIIQTLLSNNNIILMDEPISSLDDHWKKKILLYFKNLNKIFPKTIIYVTHSNFEKKFLSDYYITIKNGKII